MFEIFGFIIPLIVILVIVGIFLSFVPLGLWISAVSAGVRVNIFSLVGMRCLLYTSPSPRDEQ